jgi:hypothetical protein
MDPERTNPLKNPPEDVLKAAAHLRADPSFQRILSWIEVCEGYLKNRITTVKDELQVRWDQGGTQVLSSLSDTLGSARDKLIQKDSLKEIEGMKSHLL